jgi:hypothetical protein
MPAPSQVPIGVNVEPEHEALPHDVDVEASAHAPAPLHLPVRPQGGAGVQRPAGSLSPEGTGVHTPSLPLTPHEKQVAQLALPQQNPSTQKLPVRQSASAPHDWPSRFLFPQALVIGSQIAGARQSLSDVQAELQLWAVQA